MAENMETVKKIGKEAIDLLKNENVLNKTVGLLGMLFPYAGLEKRTLDMYLSEIEKSDLSPDAKLVSCMSVKEKIKKIKNQNSIAKIAINEAKEGTDFSETSGVDKDWLSRFMESAGLVSDKMVQDMWGKILAKEFEEPGSTPLNMVRILTEITPKYAQAFRKICGMKVIKIDLNNNDEMECAQQVIIVPYKENEKEFGELGLSFYILNELETLGLIKFASPNGYGYISNNYGKVLYYVDGKVLDFSSWQNENMPAGNVMFTSAGECLKEITPQESIDGYLEMLKKYLKKNRVMLNEPPRYQVSMKEDYIECRRCQVNSCNSSRE